MLFSNNRQLLQAHVDSQLSCSTVGYP